MSMCTWRTGYFTPESLSIVNAWCLLRLNKRLVFFTTIIADRSAKIMYAFEVVVGPIKLSTLSSPARQIWIVEGGSENAVLI